MLKRAVIWGGGGVVCSNVMNRFNKKQIYSYIIFQISPIFIKITNFSITFCIFKFSLLIFKIYILGFFFP